MTECSIPTEEIYQDIADTEAEIAVMERELKAFDILAPTDRMARFKADHRRNGIKERREFIVKLQGILRSRKEATNG